MPVSPVLIPFKAGFRILETDRLSAGTRYGFSVFLSFIKPILKSSLISKGMSAFSRVKCAARSYSITPFPLLLTFFSLLLTLHPSPLSAQQQNLHFNQGFYEGFEKYLYTWDSDFHTSIKPYKASRVYPYVYPDTVYAYKRAKPSLKFIPRAVNILFYEHLLEFSEEGYVKKSRMDTAKAGVEVRMNYTDTAYVPRKFHITANPFLRLELGYDNGPGRRVFYNKRGVILTADIGKQFSIFTSFSENQAQFPEYLDPQIRTTRVIPQEGKARNFGAQSFDFSNIWAYFNYTPNEYFSLEAGNGKHFIGDGYRSLFLSDNAYVYPYVKATASFWRFRYQLIYAELQNDIRDRTDFALGVTRKFANFNYLSAEFTPWLQVGLFEGILWQRTGPGGNNEFDPNFLNPVIGIRGLQKNLDANTLYGLNWKITLPRYVALYGQWMIDRFPNKGFQHINNRMGMQAGIKYFDVGGVENLNMRLEYNRVRPYAYTARDSAMHYSQYDAPLAHPNGANFQEIAGSMSYRYGRFYTSLGVTWSKGGIDEVLVDSSGGIVTSLVSGSEILISNKFAPEKDGLTVGGTDQNYSLVHADFRAGAIINPKINLKVELGLVLRRTKATLLAPDMNDVLQKASFTDNNAIVVFSVSTQLFNNYYDNIQRLSVIPVSP